MRVVRDYLLHYPPLPLVTTWWPIHHWRPPPGGVGKGIQLGVSWEATGRWHEFSANGRSRYLPLACMKATWNTIAYRLSKRLGFDCFRMWWR